MLHHTQTQTQSGGRRGEEEGPRKRESYDMTVELEGDTDYNQEEEAGTIMSHNVRNLLLCTCTSSQN